MPRSRLEQAYDTIVVPGFSTDPSAWPSPGYSCEEEYELDGSRFYSTARVDEDGRVIVECCNDACLIGDHGFELLPETYCRLVRYCAYHDDTVGFRKLSNASQFAPLAEAAGQALNQTLEVVGAYVESDSCEICFSVVGLPSAAAEKVVLRFAAGGPVVLWQVDPVDYGEPCPAF